LNAMNSCYLF